MTNDERNPKLECRRAFNCPFVGFLIGISSSVFFGPVWRMVQPVQHLPRFSHEQNAFVLAVREFLGANPGRVAVTEIDLLALLRRDLCGQRYARTRFFDAVFKSAQSVNVGAMSEHAPRV